MEESVMNRREELAQGGWPLLMRILGVAALAGGMMAAAPASASLPCTVAALSSLVPGVTVDSATEVPAAPPNPAFCSVSGFVKTTGFGAPDGSADFLFLLPANWNGKFLFVGVGGFAGLPSPQGIAPNPVDFAEALPLGYAIGTTDEGHRDKLPTPATPSSTDGSWSILAPGVPNQAALTDYFFRATHQVTVAGQRFTRAFFGSRLQRSYYEGCSNGGRQAYVEATKFPEDFDGIIAGDPFMDIRSLLAGENFQKQQLTLQTFLPAALLPQVDAAIRESCDAADGVVDGLIQNPAKCAFDPASLGPSGTGLLTAGQVQTLKAYFTATHDDDGNVIYTGSAVSDLGGGDGADLWSIGFFAPGQLLFDPTKPINIFTNFPSTQPTFDVNAAEPWGNFGFNPAPIGYQFTDHGIQFIIERDPAFNLRAFDAGSPIGQVSDAALRLFDQRTEPGDGDVPGKLIPFIAERRKMLIYHGLSDPALNAFRTINNYLALSRVIGLDELRETMRLFLIPGMHHCGGGPGPNTFETLTKLDNWVEHGIAPDSIEATHFTLGVPTRSMPLCAFPEEAQFSSAGGATAASPTGAGWSCDPANQGMLEVGPNGEQAGVGQQNNLFSDSPLVDIDVHGRR
jgi:feruloyl esterase